VGKEIIFGNYQKAVQLKELLSKNHLEFKYYKERKIGPKAFAAGAVILFAQRRYKPEHISFPPFPPGRLWTVKNKGQRINAGATRTYAIENERPSENSSQISPHPNSAFNGAGNRIRTGDLLITSHIER
jgi:hypothetical protein